MLGTYQCRTHKRAYYYSRLKYKEVENSLLFEVVIREMNFFESWELRLVSKGVYNQIISKYDQYRSRRVIISSPIEDIYHWSKTGLALSVRAGLCRLHRVESCLMCSFPLVSQLDRVFKDGIHRLYSGLGLKVYYRQAESFLSLCDRIVTHANFKKFRDLELSRFVVNYANFNRYISALYLSVEIVRAISWIWLMGLRNVIISSTKYDEEIKKYFGLENSCDALMMRIK